ncbi:hypothetical protein EDD21DRAFT_439362 [Dissophora ornata]|nr:hypothetical protein BGZ58_006591 [Dissophora ornata]KAI8606568.1 hypothetical protein EDD21DRAFT_439362 [Dissophora ornata]
MASSTGSGTSSGKPPGFMSGYMSDLPQSEDLNSFLQKNQPAYDPNSHSTPTDTHAATTPTSSSTATENDTKSSQDSSSKPSSSASSESTRKPFDSKTLVGSHPLPTAHAKYQRQAIQNAALDNCADLNMVLTDCLLGKSGTWWDRASMCMKAKEQMQKCCRLNREILEERGYAKEGNTPEQDRVILDYADEQAQKAMKNEKA